MKSLTHASISLILIGLIIGSVLLSFTWPMYKDPQPHFRTNIFTNSCDIGGAIHQLGSEPWYYSLGCNLNRSEKISLLKKNNPHYVDEFEHCEALCKGLGGFEANKSAFCNEYRYGICRGLVKCNEFKCKHESL